MNSCSAARCWSRQAGIRYWKVDWGARDDRESFRRLLTRIARQEAPELTVEHAAIIMPPNHWNGDGRFGSWSRESGLTRSFAPFSDVFRACDACLVATRHGKVLEDGQNFVLLPWSGYFDMTVCHVIYGAILDDDPWQ